jgi:L-threonylcarbamoyladenylate synthase
LLPGSGDAAHAVGAAVDPGLVERAADVLKRGGIVAMRTDTVYGLLASVNRHDALRRLAELKRRAPDKPFLLLAADWIGVRSVTRSVPPVARSLGARHWPGALTLVLPAEDGLPSEVTGAGPTVAVRIPGDPFLLAVVAAVRCAVAAPSANPAGEPPARSAEEVRAYFGDGVDLVIDGGAAAGDRASTIVNCAGKSAVIVREGAVGLAATDLELPE